MKTVVFCIIFLMINFYCSAQINENLLWSEVDLSDFEMDSLYNEQLKQKNQQGKLSDCEFGKKIANEEFNNKNYIYFSNELVGYCVYCDILQHDYGVRWRFLSDLFSDEYYRCYNEEMSQLLIWKYGFDIFKQSSDKANSLLNSKPASVYGNSKICIPDLIQGEKKIFIKDSYIEDTLKIRFKVEVTFENSLIDTIQPMIVKSVNLIDLDIRAVNPPHVIAFLSKLTPIESPLQQYIWDLCSAKISYWYKYQPYEKLPQGEKTRYGDRLYMTAICYLVPMLGVASTP